MKIATLEKKIKALEADRDRYITMVEHLSEMLLAAEAAILEMALKVSLEVSHDG